LDSTNIKGTDKTPRKVGKIKESENVGPQEHDVVKPSISSTKETLH
jgi:hypothetical protein